MKTWRALFLTWAILLCATMAGTFLVPSANATGRNSGSLDQAGGTCATATTIPSLPFSDTGTLDATRDCGMGGMTRPYHDVFYVYTAVLPGDHVFDMCGSAGNTYLKVWTAGTCCSGATVTADAGCTTDDPSLTVALTAGQTVYLQCGSYASNETQLAYAFNATGPQPMQPGETCVNAFPLTVPSTVNGNTCGFIDNLNYVCGSDTATGGKDVAYSYAPPRDQLLTFTLCGSSFNTKLYLYLDNCTGTPLACSNDDTLCGTGSLQSAIRCQRLNTGHTYYLVIDGVSAADCGDYTLTSGPCEDCTLRDYCADPLPIDPSVHFEQTVNTCCATDPISSVRRSGCMMMSNTSGPDAIFRLTLSSTTVVSLSASGGSDNQLMVFTDCANASGTCEGSEDMTTGSGPETITDLSLPAGTHYVSISDRGANACGSITLTFDSAPLVPGEICDSAIPLTVPSTVNGNTCTFFDNLNFNCGSDTGTGGKDVIFSYTPTEDRLLNFLLCQSSFNTKMYLYRDACSGTPIACSNDDSLCGTGSLQSALRCQRVCAGHTYYLVVDGYSAADCGDYVLNVEPCTDCSLRDYCGSPIVIGPVTHFEQTTDTRCATNPISSIHRQGCMMMSYTSGPDVIYRFQLADTGIVSITAMGTDDSQLMVFTDPANPATTCLASEDMMGAGQMESISGLSLMPGMYYVSVSNYGVENGGPITLTVDSDQLLSVALTLTGYPDSDLMVLRWSSVPGATGYNIYASHDLGSGAESLLGTTDTTVYALPLSSDRQFYWVTALLP